MGKRTASVSSDGIGFVKVRITKQRIASTLIGLNSKNSTTKKTKMATVMGTSCC